MKVSVIIPTYNEALYIGECLESLAKQSHKDFEVIVVDDGSTDNTQVVLSEYRISNIEYRMLTQKHVGAGSARNFGAKHAMGEVLVFVDADMTFERNFIKNLIKPIVSGKSKGTFSKAEYVSNWENKWAKCLNINEGWKTRKRHLENYPSYQKVFRALLKKEFDRVGGFTPGGYTDDYSLFDKLGYMASEAPNAIFYHRNPETLSEVFGQALWVGKRSYKLGYFGVLVTLFKVSLPMSMLIGLTKSLLSRLPAFFIFKIVYDFGIFIGIINYHLWKKPAK